MSKNPLRNIAYDPAPSVQLVAHTLTRIAAGLSVPEMARWTPKLLLLFVSHLLTTALNVAAQHPTRPRAPGVAFELTPNYG